MADLDQMDTVLRDALHRSAQPGDASGVADAIRARLDAGDGGTTAAGSTAPGWGGPGVLAWLPWIGVVVAAGIVGGALGASGYFGGPTADASSTEPSAVIARSVDARACVEGPAVTALLADTRVLAVLRNDDSTWVGVRNPSSLSATVWVPVEVLVVDSGDDPVNGLPIGGTCAQIVAAEEPIPGDPTAEPDDPDAPASPQQPAPAPPPVQQPGDTTPPIIQQVSVDTNACPAVISLVASDNVAVTSVTLSWTGAATGSAAMTLVAGTWRYNYDSADAPEGTMTFTAVARDAAGNTSSPSGASTYMACLI